ncbi:MAG: GldG family protein [Bdellovibrionota bacterium]
MIFQGLGITGAILLFYAMIAYAITQSSTWQNKTLLVLGAIMMIAFLIEAVRKSWLKEFIKKRKTHHGIMATVYSFIVAFILIVVNIGSQDFNKQIDLTSERINTLSEQTVKVLARLDKPMKITAFFDAKDKQMEQAKMSVKLMLDRYKAESEKIEVQFVDPDQDNILAKNNNAASGDILLKYGEQSHITKDLTEQGVTQAILKVVRTNTPVICFTGGHGEMGLDETEESPRSLSILKASLVNEGYEPKTVASLEDSIPAECTIVVVASPVQSFPASDVAVIGQYLDNGGKVLAMLDPLLPSAKIEQAKFSISKSGFEELMKKWGVNLGGDLMLEKHLELLRGEVVDLSVRAISYGNHPIVDSLKGKQTFFNTVQSVRKQEGFSGTTYELIQSLGNKKSWAETNIDQLFRSQRADPDGNDILGPVNIAVAIEKEGKSKTQMVVFGDGDFVSNALIQSHEFNYDLFLNALNWMSGEVEKISIRPKKIKTSAIELTTEESFTIFYVAIIGLPMLVLIFGINLWWYRRRKG